MTTKYSPPIYTDEQIQKEQTYLEKNEFYGNLLMIPEKRAKMIARAKGVVLEIASGCAQTLQWYAKHNNKNDLQMIIMTEPGDIEFNVGMKLLTNKLDNEGNIYQGNYEKIDGILHPETNQPIEAWKFIFTSIQNKSEADIDVPLNIPILYAQSDLDNAGKITTQLLNHTNNTKVDTVISCFGVCYVCCSIHPLDYLRKLQIIFGPNLNDNQYELLLLEHGNTQHFEINPADNIHVKRDGGNRFRHLFELMADSRMIIKDLQHVNETRQTEGPFNTFHIYQCEPNDQTEWLKSLQ